MKRRSDVKRSCIIFLVLSLLAPLPVSEAQRVVKANVYASWFNVTTTQTTIALPFTSREVTIQNGSANDVWISTNGQTIDQRGVTETSTSIFQLDGASSITLSDYLTDTISMRAVGAAASPVSVVVTY
jgi:hypothetical protein